MSTITLNHDTPTFVYGDGSGVDLRYDVVGETDALTVGALVYATSPTTYYHGLEILTRQSMRVTPVGYDVWRGEVHYARYAFADGWAPLATDYETGEPTLIERDVRYSTTANPLHVTHSRETISSYAAPGETAEDHKQAVEVDVDGTVRGTDILVPTSSIIERWSMPISRFGNEYVALVESIVGTMNIAPWRRYARGEVFLLNFEAQRSSYERWTMTFEFGIRKNRANFTIGDVTVIAKLGWDHLWVKYRQEAGTAGMTTKAVAAYVERHYEMTDFTLLGVGT